MTYRSIVCFVGGLGLAHDMQVSRLGQIPLVSGCEYPPSNRSLGCLAFVWRGDEQPGGQDAPVLAGKALTSLSVDGMIIAASTTLPAGRPPGERDRGCCPGRYW